MLRETDSLVFTGVTGTGFGSAISIPLRCVLGHPARDAPETLDCLLVPRIRAVGDPEKPLTGRSERRTGNSEDVGFGEQPLGERDRLLRNRAEVGRTPPRAPSAASTPVRSLPRRSSAGARCVAGSNRTNVGRRMPPAPCDRRRARDVVLVDGGDGAIDGVRHHRPSEPEYGDGA